MIVVTVWHGRDAYDYTLSPMLHQTFKGIDEEHLKEMISQHDKYVKSGTLPWYLITVTRFDVGGEPVSETYHRANPAKTKILLNPRAKPDPEKLKKNTKSATALWAQINAMDVYQPAFAPVNVIGAQEGAVNHNNDVWINP
jgi:hypothetical protein